MEHDDYEAAKAASRASAKPGEWCDECDDWSANCEGDCSYEAIMESRREREDEERFMQGDAYDHNRGVCPGPGCCRYCDTPPGDEPREPAFRWPVGVA